LTMTNSAFDELFGAPARAPETLLTQRDMDLAASIQAVTEEVVVRLGRDIARRTGERNLCLAGGVALNCVANGKLLREGVFDDIWIQPAAGDAGGALGAALAAHYGHHGGSRPVRAPGRDGMKAALLGPEFSREQIRDYLVENDLPHEELSDEQWAPRVAQVLAGENVVGLLQGRMEFGPRAL